MLSVVFFFSVLIFLLLFLIFVIPFYIALFLDFNARVMIMAVK